MLGLDLRAPRPVLEMPVFRLTDDLIFPDPRLASSQGLLAVGGDLSPERLVLAYELGIFPWYGQDEPILWWSPDPRCVLFPDRLYVSRRLERIIRQGRYRLTCNCAFDQVIRACASVRLHKGEETWLVEEMQSAYQRLYKLGLAHSIEAWEGEELAGGLYGVAFGKFFFGESMFHHMPNASKVILAKLSRYMASHGFDLLDCQVANPHLTSMGACQISREKFLERLAKGGVTPGGAIDRVVFPEVL